MGLLQSMRRFDSTPMVPSKRRHIPWIRSPLCEDRPASPSSAAPSRAGTGPITKSTDNPKWDHYEDSHTIELVYDMFLVAILSTFSAIHGLEDGNSTRNFVAFFTILWWTWMQTVMFDVRFGVDSIYDRVCKGITWCVTIAFMLGGALWDITKIQENKRGFILLAIALMMSRLLLVGQYIVVLLYARSYKKAVLPLVLTICTLSASAAGFLAIFFVFQHTTNDDVHIAFYVIVAIEGVAVLFISSYWRVLSFKNTNFTTRMGDATMIMLGEGAVGLALSVSKIMANSAHLTGAIGVTIAGVFLIYFTWMLYYDQIELSGFGTIRQQIWAVLHFPLNLATVFVLEGMRELVAYNTIQSLTNMWLEFQPEYSGGGLTEEDFFITSDLSYWETGTELSQYMTTSLGELRQKLNSESLKDFDKKFNTTPIVDWIANRMEPNVISEYTALSKDKDTTLSLMLLTFFTGVENAILDSFGVTPPKAEDLDGFMEFNSTFAATLPGSDLEVIADLGPDALTLLNSAIKSLLTNGKFWEVIITVQWYFPLGAGFYLLILSGMYWFGRRGMSRYEWWSIALRVLSGLAMIAYTMLLIYADEDWSMANNPMLMPVVTITFLVVIAGDNLFIWWGNRVADEAEATMYDLKRTPEIIGNIGHGGYHHVPSRHGEREVEMINMETKMDAKV